MNNNDTKDNLEIKTLAILLERVLKYLRRTFKDEDAYMVVGTEAQVIVNHIDQLTEENKRLTVENANLKTQRGCWVLFGAEDYDELRFIALYESPEDVTANYKKYGYSIKWKPDSHGGARMTGVLKAADGEESPLYLIRLDIVGEPGMPYTYLINKLDSLDADLKAALDKNAKLQKEIDDARRDVNFE